MYVKFDLHFGLFIIIYYLLLCFVFGIVYNFCSGFYLVFFKRNLYIFLVVSKSIRWDRYRNLTLFIEWFSVERKFSSIDDSGPVPGKRCSWTLANLLSNLKKSHLNIFLFSRKMKNNLVKNIYLTFLTSPMCRLIFYNGAKPIPNDQVLRSRISLHAQPFPFHLTIHFAM